MKNTFGQSISLTLFGESHGAAIGAVLDGICSGLTVDEAHIARALARRRPQSGIDTSRVEEDRFQIVSGVYNGKTTGSPICIVIPNENTRSSDYTYGIARPSHADYAAFCKYHANEDYRGGGHFSGRITASLVALGAILQDALAQLGITVGTHILQCGSACDRAFGDAQADILQLQASDFPALDAQAQASITAEILSAKADCDSIGGKTQTAICGIPAGVGEPFFDSVESMLSHALFGIGGIKGIEFGDGFALCQMRGSQANDPLSTDGKTIKSETNRQGGINGGITNGMPILFQCAVKPTPSITKEQKTVDFVKMENTTLCIKGRHDPAIVRRICPVIDAVCALVVCDLLATRFGTDIFQKGLPS
jgi:chorismate synthase